MNHNKNESHNGSGISTPKLFRRAESNASAAAGLAATDSLKASILTSNTGGFQLRTSNVSVFD